jgi:Ca2+-dependent lipid-binding protein
MDLGGASDPYVKVNHMLNGKRVKKYKTAVRMADLNPYWNASFKIPVNPYEMQKIELVIFVNDYDKFGGNDTIGWLNFSLKDTGSAGEYGRTRVSPPSAGMHWREAISQPKTNVTKWHALQPLEEEEKK